MRTKLGYLRYCFFGSVLENIARVLSIDRVYEVGAMTEGNISSTDKKTVIIVFIAKGLKIRKNDVNLQLRNSLPLPVLGVTLCIF